MRVPLRFDALIFLAFLLTVTTVDARAQRGGVRVATYNIKFLSTKVAKEGDRLSKLREVIRLLDADVIGLQEIADRPALELLFPRSQWTVVIDDDSRGIQDVAVAVRKPFIVRGIPGDLDADDRNFLFSGKPNESFFPDRRDLLAVEVGAPGSTSSFFVMVHHAKARVGGRAATDARREGASKKIVEALRRDFSTRSYVLLGDFNDNPDDRSINILEAGRGDASAGPAPTRDPFLINLTEPLLAAGHVSHGKSSRDIRNGRINTIDAKSRDRNNNARGTDKNTGAILFDQLLIPARLRSWYVNGSARVFDHEVALRGNEENSASDHLPVYADFALPTTPAVGAPVAVTRPVPPPPEHPKRPSSIPREMVRIVSLVPNPNGDDAGRESVKLVNSSTVVANLKAWKLRDRSGDEFRLNGVVAPGKTITITLKPNSMPLGNSGDEVSLISPTGEVVQRVTYTAAQAKSGATVMAR